MNPELEKLKEFHGHLGPYAVAGYRMGKLALKLLSARGKKLKALAKTGTTPPISCIIDGVQLSSCCTLGKGNISVSSERVPAVVFSGEKTIEITLSKKAVRLIEENDGSEEDAAILLWSFPEEKLFEVKNLH